MHVFHISSIVLYRKFLRSAIGNKTIPYIDVLDSTRWHHLYIEERSTILGSKRLFFYIERSAFELFEYEVEWKNSRKNMYSEIYVKCDNYFFDNYRLLRLIFQVHIFSFIQNASEVEMVLML